jgi:hypothetical protein
MHVFSITTERFWQMILPRYMHGHCSILIFNYVVHAFPSRSRSTHPCPAPPLLAGKTIMFCELVKRLGLRTLIMTNRQAGAAPRAGQQAGLISKTPGWATPVASEDAPELMMYGMCFAATRSWWIR